MYSYIFGDDEEVKKCNAISLNVTKNFTHDLYKKCIDENHVFASPMNSIISYNHRIQSVTITKTSLSSFDDKRHLVDSINSYAYGHYYDPEHGFVGTQKLYERLKDKGITIKDINEALGNQEIVQVSKKPTMSSSFVPERPLKEFQIDLIYLEHPHLNENKYALCAVDAFSKKADVQLMKNKTAKDTIEAMQKVIGVLGIP